MYRYCNMDNYDVNQVFEHINKIVEALKKEIKFYHSIEADLKSYDGKVLNKRIVNHLQEMQPKHRFSQYQRYNTYYLNISPFWPDGNIYYEIEIARSEEKITRYKHETFLKNLKSLEEKLKKYVEKLDKVTESVMKYNLAVEWLKAADNELYNTVPEINTIRRY